MTDSDGQDSGPGGLESTASLLLRVRKGDKPAREELVRRFLPALRRWAHHQMPTGIRDLSDTDDLVQNTFLRTLMKVKEFEPRHAGAFLAYLRQVLKNQIRDEIRRHGRRPRMAELDDEQVDEAPPGHADIKPETMMAYKQALETLPEEDQTAVILRVEMGFTHAEVANALDLPSPNAARMRVSRALVRLAESMDGC